MSDYEILHEEDGWWTVYRKGYCVEAYVSEDAAVAAIAKFEAEDNEAEEEAREQDEYGSRADYEYESYRNAMVESGRGRLLR